MSGVFSAKSSAFVEVMLHRGPYRSVFTWRASSDGLWHKKKMIGKSRDKVLDLALIDLASTDPWVL